MKFNFALTADTLLTTTCTFLFVFTFTRYCLHNAIIALICGISAGVACGIGAFFYIRRKQRKKMLFGKEAEEKRKLAMHLCLLPYGEACNLIAKATGGIKKGKRIECENAVYFPVFKAEPCNMDDLLPSLRYSCGDKSKIIVCNYISENAGKLAECSGAYVYDCSDVYNMLKKSDALPETYLYSEPVKVKLLKRIKTHFSRKLCLPAFWSGTGLIFMSWFTFYPVYYIISGSVLLFICISAAIFGQRKSI